MKIKTKTKKRVYQTRKQKARKTLNKYLLMMIFLFILPLVINGYYSNELMKELEYTPITVNIQPAPRIDEIQAFEVQSEVVRTVTMYNSTVEQCDSTPCISANNTNICEEAKKGRTFCASNAYPFGTILHIDKLGECEVVDRMNKRFPNRVDFYAEMDIKRAISFGKQNLNIKEVIKL